MNDATCAIVGRGRVGNALARALAAAGLTIVGPLGRGESTGAASMVLLCVPDREIENAAKSLPAGLVVGHVSASADLDLLAPHARFVMHPLLSIAGDDAQFAGATCAIDASSERSFAIACALAGCLGMVPRAIAPEQRALYHAAASMASNYVTTVLGAAESLAQNVGLDREALARLVLSAVEEWLARGAAGALTGPIARGDLETEQRQRTAVAEQMPEHLALWDALAAATHTLAEQAK